MASAANSLCLLFLPVALLLSKYRNMTPDLCRNALSAEIPLGFSRRMNFRPRAGILLNVPWQMMQLDDLIFVPEMRLLIWRRRESEPSR